MTTPQTDAPERVYDYDINEVKSALTCIAVEDIPYGPNLVKGVMMDAAHALDARDAAIAALVEAGNDALKVLEFLADGEEAPNDLTVRLRAALAAALK